jgi:hypothetical protein
LCFRRMRNKWRSSSNKLMTRFPKILRSSSPMRPRRLVSTLRLIKKMLTGTSRPCNSLTSKLRKLKRMMSKS